jgi:N-acetylglucosaminyldiphosphoundecaprenol N-acetyl-beta-D-mannosaminyltransferase
LSTRPVERFLSFDVYAGGIDACVASIAECVASGDRLRWFACLNPHSYAVSQANPRFASALRDSDWLVADGIAVVMASRLLGGAVPERITGSDVFEGVSARLNASHGRVFFLGSTEETLRDIRQNMARDYPNVTVAGTYSPPFKAEYSEAEIDNMVAAINAARADVLWVGMTAPKQEMWIHAVRERLNVRFAGAIGAVFDFYTGRIKRSHPIVQRLGMEWVSRFVQEPRRLWRRVFISIPIYLRDVAWERVRPSRR